MRKPILFTILLGLPLTGCQLVKRSPIWDKVNHVRTEEAYPDDPSRAFAGDLHRVLLHEGVPHIVVTYNYHHGQRFLEPAGTRTAVIYEDNSNPSSPWWLKDDELPQALWLPNGDVESQLRFYVRGPVQVVESTAYLIGDKTASAPPIPRAPEPQRPSAVTTIEPAAPAEPVAVVKPAPAPEPAPQESPTFAASERVKAFAHFVTTPIRYVVEHFPRKKSEPAPAPAPEPKAEPAPKPAAHETKAPAKAKKKPGKSSKSKAEWAELFRKKNGTKYDPKSPSDRAKMKELKAAHSA